MNRREMRHTRLLLKLLLTFVIFAVLPFVLEGQQKEVRVVKPYSPTLSGAEKIQLLPSLEEEIEFETPDFTYELFPKRYDSKFRVEPIRAARMVKMPLKKLMLNETRFKLAPYDVVFVMRTMEKERQEARVYRI